MTSIGCECPECNGHGLITCACGECSDGVVIREAVTRSHYQEYSFDTIESRCGNARALTAREAREYHAAYIQAQRDWKSDASREAA